MVLVRSEVEGNMEHTLFKFNLIEFAEKKAERLLVEENDDTLKKIIEASPDKVQWLKDNIKGVQK